MIRSFRERVESVIFLLVTGEYEELERLTVGVRLTASEISTAIRQYDRRLVHPPPSAHEALDTVLVINSTPPQWSVRMRLWTAEEGTSDLTLETTVIQTEKGYRIELDDIHVL